MKETYLITGCRGMLGTSLMELLTERGIAAFGTDLPEVDLTDADATDRLFQKAQPTHVIHCAAYTDVNGAETCREICRAANVVAPRVVAQACSRQGARMISISTDYVFGGNADKPYAVDDPTGPVSYYGQSKLEGELAVRESLDDSQIVRTAWLFGAGKRTFVSAIVGALRRGGPVKVVQDEIGSPTYAPDLAEGLLALSRVEATGVFHMVNSGQCSRFEMAQAIARHGGFDPSQIVPIRSADWVSPAARPLWSVLDTSRAQACGVGPLRPWEEALRAFLQRHLG